MAPRAIPAPGQIIHNKSCHPMIVTGINYPETIYATIFRPAIAPTLTTTIFTSPNWHWPSDACNA